MPRVKRSVTARARHKKVLKQAKGYRGTYYIPPEVAGQGIKAVHPYPFCANEDSHIVGQFDSEYAYANFPKIQLNPGTPIRRNYPGLRHTF